MSSRIPTADERDAIRREGSCPPVGGDPFVLWQLIDSAFPTGGFAHSGGLEAAWNHGAISNRTALQSWILSSLWQVGNGQLPLVRASWLNPGDLIAVDRFCEAWTSNHVASRASRLQGRALVLAAQRSFPIHLPLRNGPLPFQHFAPVFGAVAQLLGLDISTTLRAFLFMHLRSAVASAVRLNIVGPMEAQAMQHQLGSPSEAVVQHAMTLNLEDVAQISPLLDIWQAAHDRLQTRLFQT